MYAAAWAFTAPRHAPLPEPVGRTSRPDAVEARGAAVPTPAARTGRRTPPDVPAGAWFGSGAALMLALVALVRRRKKD